jgi:hypothetical protein
VTDLKCSDLNVIWTRLSNMKINRVLCASRTPPIIQIAQIFLKMTTATSIATPSTLSACKNKKLSLSPHETPKSKTKQQLMFQLLTTAKILSALAKIPRHKF